MGLAGGLLCGVLLVLTVGVEPGSGDRSPLSSSNLPEKPVTETKSAGDFLLPLTLSFGLVDLGLVFFSFPGSGDFEVVRTFLLSAVVPFDALIDTALSSDFVSSLSGWLDLSVLIDFSVVLGSLKSFRTDLTDFSLEVSEIGDGTC